MDKLALIGVSHRRGGVKALETWQEQFTLETISALGLKEFVPLLTCNRWNLLTVLSQGQTIDSLREELKPKGEKQPPYAYTGEAALEQLCRVSASLDSLNPGEDQIMSQVRSSFAFAKAQGWTGKLSSFAFSTALRVAKRVRREVALAPMNTSLFSLARPALEKTLSPGAGVVVIGAGDMASLAAKTLSCMNVKLTIVNRSKERASSLAESVSAEAMSLEDFLSSSCEFEGLVTAVAAKDTIDKPFLANLKGLKIVVDLGMPRNVKPGSLSDDVQLLDVERLQLAGQARRKALAKKIAQAEQMIQEEVGLAVDEWTERQLGPSIKRLRELYLDTIAESLPEGEAAKLAHKFAHVPTKGLRAVAREYGLDAAKLFLQEAGVS